MKRSDIKQWCRIDRAVLKSALSRPTPLMALFGEVDKTQESQQMKKLDSASVPVFDDFVEAMTEHFGSFDGIYGESDGPKLLAAASADCYALAHAMVRSVQQELDLEKYMHSISKNGLKRNEAIIAALEEKIEMIEPELARYVDHGSKKDPLSK